MSQCDVASAGAPRRVDDLMYTPGGAAAARVDRDER